MGARQEHQGAKRDEGERSKDRREGHWGWGAGRPAAPRLSSWLLVNNDHKVPSPNGAHGHPDTEPTEAAGPRSPPRL